MERAQQELAQGSIDQAISLALEAAEADPSSEYIIRFVVDALVRAERRQHALDQADRYLARRTGSGLLWAQRGFVRSQMRDLSGALQDFAAAVAAGGLDTEQLRNIEAAVDEVRAAQIEEELAEAQRALSSGDFNRAVEITARILRRAPNVQAAMYIQVRALWLDGRKREALREGDAFIARGASAGLLLAERAFIRRSLGDPKGASDDFTAALRANDLTAEQRDTVEASLGEAREALGVAELAEAQTALDRAQFESVISITERILARSPDSDLAIRIRLAALANAGRKREALSEADAFIARSFPGSLLLAQRGFLRRDLGDLRGAAEDFAAALSVDGLTAEQRRNIEASVAEARTSESQIEIERAQRAFNEKDYERSLELARAILVKSSDSRVAQILVVDSFSRMGRMKDALSAAEAFLNEGRASGYQYAQRGYLRDQLGNRSGAREDFRAALVVGDLTEEQRRRIEGALRVSSLRHTFGSGYAPAQLDTAVRARARQAERHGDVEGAVRLYRNHLRVNPRQADLWYDLAYLLLRHQRANEAAEALLRGLEVRPIGSAYLDAGYASLRANPVLASRLFRRGADRYLMGDTSLREKTPEDIERVRNEIVRADASISALLAAGGIISRPPITGGRQYTMIGETAVRFDGRYLPNVPGLEMVLRGYNGRDDLGVKEASAGVGLRIRPLQDINLSVSVLAERYVDSSLTQATLYWGLGFGAQAYPYSDGWIPYWDLATFGAYRTGEQRLLQDLLANGGALYRFRDPIRIATGPALLAVAGYDSKNTSEWASGIGPSLLTKIWLGGDKYRGYDAVFTLQSAYVWSVGADRRQQGFRLIGTLGF